LAYAARDSRVHCIVCHIGAINAHANWINRHPQYRGEKAIRELAAKQSRGEIFPWQLSKPKGLDGMPNLPKTVCELTKTNLDGASEVRVPVMLLAAKKEETFHNSKNSDLVYNMLKDSDLVYNMLKDKVPVVLEYLPGAHYDAHDGEAYKKGVARAIDWFRTYVGDQGQGRKIHQQLRCPQAMHHPIRGIRL